MSLGYGLSNIKIMVENQIILLKHSKVSGKYLNLEILVL